jgi:FlaA1/EpsC-like NDP-sugar epimerase
VFNAAALKQVPTCEYFPVEAVQTNILGPVNIVRAIHENALPVSLVVGISTDKACKPINVMGMTKALQERVFIQANIDCLSTRFVCVRYGNVIASRGSVVPLFKDQVEKGGPVTLTLPEMTRFLLSLDKAVDTIFAASRHALRGETYVPKVPAAYVEDIARACMNGKDIEIKYIGIRPGEKIHEIMVSEEECYRTVERDGYFVIRPMLPELRSDPLGEPVLRSEYSSSNVSLGVEELKDLLSQYKNSRLDGVPA